MTRREKTALLVASVPALIAAVASIFSAIYAGRSRAAANDALSTTSEIKGSLVAENHVVYDLESSNGKLVLVSVSGFGHVDKAPQEGVTVQILLDGALVAQSIDFRAPPLGLDNEPFGASASYSFVANATNRRIEAKVFAREKLLKPTPKFSALQFALPEK